MQDTNTTGLSIIPIENPISKGLRNLAFHITQAEKNNYEVDFLRCKNVGGDAVTLTLLWNTLELDTGYNFTFLDIANTFYPVHEVKVSLCLSPIGAIKKSVPTKYQNFKFSDSIVINGFQTLLKKINERIPKLDLTAIILGNEVDLYFNNSPEEWLDYKVFVDSNIKYIKELWGDDIKVGTETTFSSMIKTSVQQIKNLNENCDIIVLSYYPIDEKFNVKSISSLTEDLNSVFNLYPDKKIYIEETGCPSSKLCKSSEESQQLYLNELFRLWDKNREKISFVGLLWLTDLSEEVTDNYVKDYIENDNFPHMEAFRAYLQTTGLRTFLNNGEDKLGFEQIREELRVRNW